MKSCSNCGKNHKNRKDNLCNDCRVKPTYPLCKCLKHHIYYGNSCRTCFKKELKIYSFI